MGKAQVMRAATIYKRKASKAKQISGQKNGVLKRPSAAVAVRKKPSALVGVKKNRCIHPSSRRKTFAGVKKRPTSRKASGSLDDGYPGMYDVLCRNWLGGACRFGANCFYRHEESPQEAMRQMIFANRLPLNKSAGICFFVDEDAIEAMQGPYWVKPCQLESGPMRVRIVGNIEDLGLVPTKPGIDETWDPLYGVDLLWQRAQNSTERSGWHSMPLQVAPGTEIEFSVIRMDQAESHPGTLQGNRLYKVHDSRTYEWGSYHQVQAPEVGEILEVKLNAKHCTPRSFIWPETRVLPRSERVASVGGVLPRMPQAGGFSCHTFDAADGVVLNFCLYMPPGSKEQPDIPSKGWPLAIFLHSMHGKLDGDNNLFYESDTPLRLLLGFDECPKSLRDGFIMIAPQCPTDYDRPQGAGIWLRHGWYETSTYAPEIEAGLMALIESVSKSCPVDRSRVALVGSSMGAYASLELAARHPNTFSAAALIAAHYDLDPVDDLITRLTKPQAIPLWFFHAQNDNMCPISGTESLVAKLREHSRAEIRFTSYLDTWSGQGHCADPVAFFAKTPGSEAPAHGEELFEWLASQLLS